MTPIKRTTEFSASGEGKLFYRQFSGRAFDIDLKQSDIEGQIRTSDFYTGLVRTLDERIYDWLVMSGLRLEMDPKSLGKNENQENLGG
jgi:hypothetical protein